MDQSLTLFIPPPLVFDSEISGRRPAASALWPTDMWISRFMIRFNLKKNSGRGTMYSKSGLLCQLVPSLEMTYVLRELFQIPGGKGRILNIDESMTYRYDQEQKKWTY